MTSIAPRRDLYRSVAVPPEKGALGGYGHAADYSHLYATKSRRGHPSLQANKE